MSTSPLTHGAIGHRSLIFLHIPKTAGITLYRIIEKQYPPSAIFNIGTPRSRRASAEDLAKIPEARRNKIRCLQGHMIFGLHSYLLQPCTYITFLRDPVDRIISHYYYVLNNAQHYLHEQVTSRRMSLSDYVSSGITPELTDGQTRLLAGNAENLDRDMLQSAQRNLREHFAVVGLTERFDESLVLMKRRLGWRNVFYTKENVTRGRAPKSAIPQSIISQIEQSNEKDIQLYTFARRLFEEALQAEGPSFQSEVENFRSKNKVYGKFDWANPRHLHSWWFRRFVAR
jgi:hypothetical protein